ncbi:uncharacterized protein LOC143186302 [Calliopsis andreniformis]|uniref:uncharacterized protein LOC143186302 n=1 Tax=Calliopsis andreniformis TaxID=337506 RepID=UPI003FCCBE49
MRWRNTFENFIDCAEYTVVRKQRGVKEREPSIIISFIGKFRTRRVRSQSRSVEMHLTSATLYALRLSVHRGAVSGALRRNAVERNITKSALVLATVGLSMSIFSVKKMLASKHRGRL